MTVPARQRFAKKWLQLPLVDTRAARVGLGVPTIRLSKKQEAEIIIAKIRRLGRPGPLALVPAPRGGPRKVHPLRPAR